MLIDNFLSEKILLKIGKSSKTNTSTGRNKQKKKNFTYLKYLTLEEKKFIIIRKILL